MAARNSILPEQNKTKSPDPFDSDTIAVTVETLDRICKQFDIERIDLLKLDTQGEGFDILTGDQQVLLRGIVEVLVTEFFFVPHYEVAPLLDEIWTLLWGHGYELFDIFIGPHEANDQARFGDAVFVNPQFRASFLDIVATEC